MKRIWQLGWLLAAGAGALVGQMHKVAKPETVVRAVGVYEWTGEMAKPTASRLIPVTLYIDKNIEDAGVYLARPVPFALQSGFVYELDEAGVPKGDLDLAYARHLQATNLAEAYDDGWFGYGSFKPLAVPKKTVARKLPQARTVGIETASSATDPDKPHFTNKAGQPVTPASVGGDGAKTDAGKKDDAPADPDRPHFSKKDGAPATDSKPDASTDPAASTKPATADDPDRPTMKRRTGNDTADTSTASASTTTPAGDPDRPTMKRRSDTPDVSSTTATSSGPSSDDDADRPTLKRHSVEDAKKKQRAESQSTVTAIGSLNDDPDRPNLHRGKPTSAMTEADLPKLAGLPGDLRQMVAVSDAANRPVHDFSRAWEDDAERTAVLGKMQALAQAQLAAYAVANPSATPAPAKPVLARTSSKRRAAPPAKATAAPLMDEQLTGYLLSYGDVPTFVYQAHTGGTGADLRYVTVIAQRDAQGEPKMVLHNVTDATHLDRTPRLRLVDAVDVEASNRASLLFEMRGQTSRQFGLYRVLGLQAQQIFTTGTMQ